MQYYTVSEVIKITGAKENKAYQIIRNLNKKFKKKYPECEIIQGKVQKKFFHEAMGFEEENILEEYKGDQYEKEIQIKK